MVSLLVLGRQQQLGVNSAAVHVNPSVPAQGVQQLEFVVAAAGPVRARQRSLCFMEGPF